MQNSMLISLSLTSSLKKWNWIRMCFVLPCRTGSLETEIVELLSQNNVAGPSCLNLMLSKTLFNQIIWYAAKEAAMYSALVVESATISYNSLSSNKLLHFQNSKHIQKYSKNHQYFLPNHCFKLNENICCIKNTVVNCSLDIPQNSFCCLLMIWKRFFYEPTNQTYSKHNVGSYGC